MELLGVGVAAVAVFLWKLSKRTTRPAPVSARVRCPSGVRLAVGTDLDRFLPPIITSDGVQIRGNRPDMMFETPGLAIALKTLALECEAFSLRCDGSLVVAGFRSVPPHLVSTLHDVVATIARWDDGFAGILAALPGAAPHAGADLDPAVTIAPGDVIVGVSPESVLVVRRDLAANHDIAADRLDPATHARVARAGNGELMVDDTSIRFTWRGVERDPERIQAAIDAVRHASAMVGLYR
jgi:hypothetical protein